MRLSPKSLAAPSYRRAKSMRSVQNWRRIAILRAIEEPKTPNPFFVCHLSRNRELKKKKTQKKHMICLSAQNPRSVNRHGIIISNVQCNAKLCILSNCIVSVSNQHSLVRRTYIVLVCKLHISFICRNLMRLFYCNYNGDKMQDFSFSQ